MARPRSMVAALLVLAACGGDGAVTSTTVAVVTTVGPPATTTTEAGFEVTSEDGDLTVGVPVAAMAVDPGITIRVLAPEEYPPELAGVADDPEARIYQLEPDGLEFAAPVTVTRRLDAVRFPDLAPNEVPVVLLLTRDANGGYEAYADPTVTRDGDDVYVSGTTTHFSPVVTVRETTTATVSIDREQIENVASMRSIESVLTLLAEVPGSAPVTATFRGDDGTVLNGTSSFGPIDGVSATPTGSILDIRCEDVAEVEVMPIRFSAVFGSSAIGGVVEFITMKQFVADPGDLEIGFELMSRLRCLDSSGSILTRTLPDFEVASDHPGGTVWILDQNFLGGLSGAYATLRYAEGYPQLMGGLICDNDFNGVIDPTDTMFPPYMVAETGSRYTYTAPLFAYGNYFIYLADASQYSGLPDGTTWAVSEGLGVLESMYTGNGRFEASLGVVGFGGNPFTYVVGPSEEAQSVPEARIEMFGLLGTRLSF